MEELIKVFILGVIEGITEFLPISSTGHLLVASSLLNSDVAARLGGTFEIFIQIGAVIAVVVYYRADLWRQVRTVRTDRRVQRFWLNIVIASIPAAVFGFLARDFIRETLFDPDSDIRPLAIGTALILGGVVFLWLERRGDLTATTEELETVTTRQAISVGLAQTIALIPGVSRSGASIVGGLLAGMDRKVATTFSFYLAIPVLGGATVLDLLLSLDELELQSGDLFYLLLGAVISGIIAWIAIGWLLRYVASNDFTIFGWYRIFAGMAVIGLLVGGIL
jgi:undecaprenyl-diphosphatase